MRYLLLLSFVSLFNLLISQTSDTKVNIDAVSIIFTPDKSDTCITEYSGDSNYKAGKIKKYYEFYEAVFSESYNYYNKFSKIISEKLRDEFEKKLKQQSLIDTLKSSASYRPNDLSCQITITKFNVFSIGYGFSIKHVYQLEAKVAMLNKKDKEVYSYNEEYNSTIKKVTSLVKLTNGVQGIYDYGKLDLLYDTIIKESVQTILSKTRLDEFRNKKDGIKDFDINAQVAESSQSKATPEKITAETNESLKDTTNEEKPPVFSPLSLKTKNKKLKQELSEAINSVIVVQIGQTKGSGIIISDDGYILTSYALMDGDSTKECEVTFPDGKKTKAVVARINAYADLLVLKVYGFNYTPLILNGLNEPKVTNDIYAVGSTGSVDLGQSISKGIVSGIRVVEKKPIYQINAKINVWQMGGGLFNQDGALVGMLYSKLIGRNVEGIGFALTNQYILKSLNLKYD